MALVPCPECGRQISTKAEACPHCGCPASQFGSTSDQDLREESDWPLGTMSPESSALDEMLRKLERMGRSTGVPPDGSPERRCTSCGETKSRYEVSLKKAYFCESPSCPGYHRIFCGKCLREMGASDASVGLFGPSLSRCPLCKTGKLSYEYM
jgi:hypothetical protein